MRGVLDRLQGAAGSHDRVLLSKTSWNAARLSVRRRARRERLTIGSATSRPGAMCCAVDGRNDASGRNTPCGATFLPRIKSALLRPCTEFLAVFLLVFVK